MSELLNHIDEIHTTPLGEKRIRKNLSNNETDIVGWCKQKISSPDAQIIKSGKNWYVYVDNITFTVNSFNYCIITAKKGKYLIENRVAKDRTVVHHVCIQTNNYIESKNFYLDVLGMKLELETPNFHGREFNSWFSLGSFMIELQTPKTDDTFSEIDSSHTGVSHFCFFVDDIDSAFDEIQKSYGEKMSVSGKGLYQVGNVKLFKIVAPEGTIIEFRNQKTI